ncbi:MAG: hypothetical protein NVSMB1_17250 [Polyangiales bacterium]
MPLPIPDFGTVRHVAEGPHTSIVESAFGYFVVHARDGVTGPYASPVDDQHLEAIFIDADDSVYIADRRGALFQASYRAALGLSPFKQVGFLPSARHWSAGARVVAATSGTEVFVSTDHGATFGASAPRTGEDVAALIVRFDDTLVTQTRGAAGLSTFLSHDRGASWTASTRVPPIDMVGAWIFGDDESCGSLAATWAVLARDGRTWVMQSPMMWSAIADRVHRVKRVLSASAELVAFAEGLVPSSMDPRPPLETRPAYPGYPMCEVASGSRRRSKQVKMLESGAEVSGAEECEGVECIWATRSARLPPTKTRGYLLHDGLCHPSDATGEACRDGVSLVRAPHLLLTKDPSLLRQPTVWAIPLPTACTPRFTAFSSGLIVLLCQDTPASSRIYTMTAEGRWHSEGTLPIDARVSDADFEMTTDGTAMLAWYAKDRVQSKAWVRAPWDVGATSVWREVSRPNAVVYALREGGSVDIVDAEPSAGPHSLSLLEDTPHRSPTAILSHVHLEGDLWCIGRIGSQIVGILRTTSGSFLRVAFEHGAARTEGVLTDGRDHLDPTGRCGF